jgi:glycolate oxidase iron-sulfur subunit
MAIPAQARTPAGLAANDSMSGMSDDPSASTRRHIAALADQCVMCGLCLPHCPTYAQDRQEAESPRGRIALARALADGTLDADAGLRAHLDHCLGCMACERVCPSGVRYGELLVETRALLGPAPDRPRLLLGVLKRPALLRVARAVSRGLRVPRWWPALARLPATSAWCAALQVIAGVGHARPAGDGYARPRPAAPDPEASRARPPPRAGQEATPKRVALFPGCVASVEDAAAQEAARRLLIAAGFVVDVLPAFCCGALDLHDGAADGAAHSARRVGDVWRTADADILATVTPGCLGTLRRALPGARVEHVPVLLATHADVLRFRPLAQRVALHLPCTQVNVAGDGPQLEHLLRRIPQLDVQTVPPAPGCCGAAGSHMLQFPLRAADLRRQKQAQVAALAPELLLSSNIGCRLHLGVDSTVPSAHPLVLLARQIVGESIAAEAAPTTEGSPLRTIAAS